jgi:hypothetical protein
MLNGSVARRNRPSIDLRQIADLNPQQRLIVLTNQLEEAVRYWGPEHQGLLSRALICTALRIANARSGREGVQILLELIRDRYDAEAAQGITD